MNLTETVKRRVKMRSDYGLYIVALICFIIAGVLLAVAIPLEQMSAVAIAMFVILGILFAAGGYALRPKVVVKAPVSPPPAIITEPSPSPTPPLPPTEEQVPPAPPKPPLEEVPTPQTPAPTLEEPAKVEEEKPVRRRRRKKTA